LSRGPSARTLETTVANTIPINQREFTVAVL
jgi:hypothetical protein